MTNSPKSPVFHPAPGYLLCKPLTREDLSSLSTSLALPDNVGKESDAVGVAEVLENGGLELGTVLALRRLSKFSKDLGIDIGNARDLKHPHLKLKAGDLVAYMPFTDMIIMDGYEKRALISWDKIVAVAQVPSKPMKISKEDQEAIDSL